MMYSISSSSPAAEKAGYTAIRADHEARPGTITEQMYDRSPGD